MTSKTCSRCKEVKPVSEFHKRKNRKSGLRSQCKKCINAANRRYREANKEKVRERTRRWSESNKEKVAEKTRRYRENNRNQLSRKAVKRNRERNDRSLEFAHRQGLPWEDWEDEFVFADNGLTCYQKAVNLGRAYRSIIYRRSRLRKSARAELTNA